MANMDLATRPRLTSIFALASHSNFRLFPGPPSASSGALPSGQEVGREAIIVREAGLIINSQLTGGRRNDCALKPCEGVDSGELAGRVSGGEIVSPSAGRPRQTRRRKKKLSAPGRPAGRARHRRLPVELGIMGRPSGRLDIDRWRRASGRSEQCAIIMSRPLKSKLVRRPK